MSLNTQTVEVVNTFILKHLFLALDEAHWLFSAQGSCTIGISNIKSLCYNTDEVCLVKTVLPAPIFIQIPGPHHPGLGAWDPYSYWSRWHSMATHNCGLCCQKQVSQVGICNCIPQYSVGCNYVSVFVIPASGNKVHNYHVKAKTKWSLYSRQHFQMHFLE